MAARVEIAIKDGLPDVVGEQTRKKLEEAGIPVRSCRFVETYSIEADLSEEELKRLGEEAFVDLIIQEARWITVYYTKLVVFFGLATAGVIGWKMIFLKKYCWYYQHLSHIA